jgi:enoyl-CoA hydratase/carnithine racemase
MEHSMTEHSNGAVTLDRPEHHLLVVTINRPNVHNSVNLEVALGLAHAIRVSEEDPDIWTVVLTGRGGRAFCTGADLNVVADGNLDQLFLPDGGFAGFVQAPRNKVWIAAVDGFALAGGFEIALACDMIIATGQSVFGLPEVQRGLLASAGGVYRLSRKIPANIANELIATGDRLGCVRAHAFGLVNHIAEANGALDAAIELARKICENAPIAVRESLSIARLSPDMTDEALYALSQERQLLNMTTQDFAEGPRAFIEKRKPNWIGA